MSHWLCSQIISMSTMLSDYLEKTHSLTDVKLIIDKLICVSCQHIRKYKISNLMVNILWLRQNNSFRKYLMSRTYFSQSTLAFLLYQVKQMSSEQSLAFKWEFPSKWRYLWFPSIVLSPSNHFHTKGAKPKPVLLPTTTAAMAAHWEVRFMGAGCICKKEQQDEHFAPRAQVAVLLE